MRLGLWQSRRSGPLCRSYSVVDPWHLSVSVVETIVRCWLGWIGGVPRVVAYQSKKFVERLLVQSLPRIFAGCLGCFVVDRDR